MFLFTIMDIFYYAASELAGICGCKDDEKRCDHIQIVTLVSVRRQGLGLFSE
jgi:hypothetical protein